MRPDTLNLMSASRSSTLNEIITEAQHVEVLRLPFTIQNTTRWSTVYVIPDIWRPCIIGNNFIRTHNLHIDGAHQRVYFPTIPTNRNLSDVYTPYQKRCSTQGIHTKHVEIPFSSSPPQVHDISYTNKPKTPESSDFSDSTLLEDQQQQLSDLIRLFPNVFSTNPGRTNKIQHHIDIQPGNKPRNSAPYRYSPARRQIIESNLNEMLQEGIITPSKSPWASPVVLAPKKDDSMRFCIDYRKLNKIISRSSSRHWIYVPVIGKSRWILPVER
ncbi:unnamed protein product [Rotaria magnacalcarata]|uniref:Uncharacterized protein n=1 Tax=Rotaria magnacalcarata TaxID=392030 RepID=A0A816QCN4_9BILA|nr:unnamed protein product [Rotaria magnacalcarata]CAF4410541.1 unnamed protein product [Rotaria magnacalcarata]